MMVEQLEKQKARQAKYWQARSERIILQAEKSAEELSALYLKLYQEAAKKIQAEIERFYGKYARDVGVTIEEAQKALSKLELKEYWEQTQEYYDAIKDTGYEFDPLYRQKLHRRLSLKSAVSRLEALKSQIQWEIEYLYAKQQTEMTQELMIEFHESYYNTVFNIQQGVSFGSPFSTLNKAAIDKAVKEIWLGSNYSDRIWQNKDRLITSLEQAIPQGIILGHNPRKIVKEILALNRDEKDTTPIKTALFRAERLARTEFNNIANQASISGYKEADIELYKILATLDNRTSDICQDMDGKKFPVGTEETGVNFPPFHPFCRTTTIPYFEPDEIDAMFEKGTRIARDPKTGKNYHVPADMTFKEWLDKMPPEQRNEYDVTRKMVTNTVSDKRQFANYKAFIREAKGEYGKEKIEKFFEGFPKRFEDFQNLKYREPKKWEIFKANRAELR